jgi:hypothetical protein
MKGRASDMPPMEIASAAAVDFLKQLRPGGPWVLTAIVPDGPTETITARDAKAVDAFVGKHDGKRISITRSIRQQGR